jgi:hypothetical protein
VTRDPKFFLTIRGGPNFAVTPGRISTPLGKTIVVFDDPEADFHGVAEDGFSCKM